MARFFTLHTDSTNSAHTNTRTHLQAIGPFFHPIDTTDGWAVQLPPALRPTQTNPPRKREIPSRRSLLLLINDDVRKRGPPNMAKGTSAHEGGEVKAPTILICSLARSLAYYETRAPCCVSMCVCVLRTAYAVTIYYLTCDVPCLLYHTPHTHTTGTGTECGLKHTFTHAVKRTMHVQTLQPASHTAREREEEGEE